MPDEQIDRVLEEARQEFMMDEIMRPIRAYTRMFDRLAPQMDPEERFAALLMMRLGTERLTKRNQLTVELMHVLRESLRWDGLCYPPPIPAVAERLGVSPAEVEAGLTALEAWGQIEEVPPGIIFRRRRFRAIPPGGDIIPAGPPPS
ncbi:MAG TPA: hypothetical protein VHG93_28990 [Longimicrobium sp.]|nr:hypothetical protein [Longimicrobium sp.]